MLNLNNPIYEITSAYGHFEENYKSGEFWEKTDKQDWLVVIFDIYL